MKVIHQAINLLYVNLHESSSLIQIQNQTLLLVKSLILGQSGFHEGLDPKSSNWHVCICGTYHNPSFKVMIKCKNKHDVKQNKMEAWFEMDGIFIGFFN
jgi:hypothetical protein